MKYSIAELKLADELCFQDDFERLAKKYIGDDWVVETINFKRVHGCSLLKWIFNISRAELKKGFNAIIDNMIAEIIHGNQREQSA